MFGIKRSAAIICLLGIFLLASVGCALSKESPAIVNLMLDADISHLPTPEQKQAATNSLINLINEVDPRGLNATIFVSGDMVSAYRLGITLQGTMSNHELALYGNNTGEDLSSLSAAKQKATLSKARDALYSCYVCGGKHVDIKGFRPQGFDQNEDTFPILEDLGIVYDAGFQAGLIYTPGHENDTWPYLIDGSKLYAVPVSNHPYNGELVFLYDGYAKEKKLSGSQWHDLLISKFDESAKAGEPMVVIFSNRVSGDGDYLDAYRNFLGYAESKGANFVTTMQLVDMAAARQPGGSLALVLSTATEGVAHANSSEKGVIADCPDCEKVAAGRAPSIIDVTIQRKNNCPTCNQLLNQSLNSSKTE